MQTKKLYDIDPYLNEFTAEIISCTKDGNLYDVILDKTAFFPEGGGQPADTGIINGTEVVDVQIKDGVIIHKTLSPVECGTAECKLNWDLRFRRMQNHSGEHIISGIAHKIYGCNNVGFHMGAEMTVDFDIELDKDQLRLVEKKANEAVYNNVRISAEYPSAEILESLDYRSKLDLAENVRIVTVENYDVCACCAPHVKNSGEIGIIKILSSARHRGGTRITMICGQDALEDYCIKADNLYEIAVALCAKHNEELEAFRKLCAENSELKQKVVALTKELTALKAQNCESTNGFTLFFEENDDMQSIRSLALESAKSTGTITAVFGGKSGTYKFAIASMTKSVKPVMAELSAQFKARGGGSDELVQGNISANENEIREFFNKVKI
jgi:alanyl-tRNA synthetase